MAYNKHDWQDGELITSAGLNNIEDGIIGKYIDVDMNTTQKYDNQSKTVYWVTEVSANKRNGEKTKLKHGFSKNDYNANLVTASEFNSENENAILVINGAPMRGGNVIKDGEILKSEKVLGKETLGLKSDGSLTSYVNGTLAADILNDGVIDAWSGFFTLVKNGVIYDYKAVANQETDPNSNFDYLNKPHPRQIIGQRENGNYVIITSDGRKNNSIGFTLDDSARVCISEGMYFAFNLDGGGSVNTILNSTRIGGTFDDNGETERVNNDFIYVESTTTFDISKYVSSKNSINSYLDLKYNIQNETNKLINYQEPTVIPVENTFVSNEVPLRFNKLNGGVNLFGRVSISKTITDTSVIHGVDYPIFKNIDFGTGVDFDIIIPAFISGGGGSGTFVKTVYSYETHNLYIYEPTDKVGILSLSFYYSLPFIK